MPGEQVLCMKIDIADAVRNTGEEVTAEYHGAMPGIEFLGERYDFPDGVHVTAGWRYDGEGVIMTGHFMAESPVNCARCLETFAYNIGFDFAEYYKEQPEEGMYAYQGEMIDLTQMLEDNVVINLPTKLLCRQDCKGLCSRCGADLNAGSCSCLEAEEANRFSGLSKLYDDDEEV
jgi:uncharacterized protein